VIVIPVLTGVMILADMSSSLFLLCARSFIQSAPSVLWVTDLPHGS
jgi:hypothetical protein